MQVLHIVNTHEHRQRQGLTTIRKNHEKSQFLKSLTKQ